MNPGIFYLYEYENYKRRRNVGFIKVSHHYQSCILQINARGIPVRNGSSLSLSAFCCEENTLLISPVADLPPCGRNISVRLSVLETHFPERRSLQQIDGFLLQNTDRDAPPLFWMASSFFFDINPEMMRPAEPETALQPEAVSEEAPVIETETSSGQTDDITSEPALQSAEAKDLPQVKKISREDLTLLPRKFWPLASNSFLLHGYHNYNHLALVEENGRRWLGVPGIYDTREARAADLFGFPRFTRAYVSVLELTDEERNDTADFGHWCRCVGTI